MANPVPSPEELARTQAILESSRDEVFGFCARLAPSDWAKSDGDSRWTIAQILDHLLIVERGVAAVLENMLSAAPDPDWEAKTAAKDGRLASAAVVETRVSAAPAVLPHTDPNPEALLRDFREAREHMLALAARPGVPLKQYVRVHPVLGEVNALQNLRLVGYHTLRHLTQMRGCL